MTFTQQEQKIEEIRANHLKVAEKYTSLENQKMGEK